VGTSFRQSIQDLLTALPTQKLEALKQLFWSELNYARANAPLSTRAWTDGAAESLAEAPVLFATAAEGFHIIYCRLAGNLNLTTERLIVGKILPEHPYGLFVFSDIGQMRWHFVNVKYTSSKASGSRRLFRRITVAPYEFLRTATERITLLDVELAQHDLFGVSPAAVQALHDEAFDVEKVTKKFFEKYREIFELAEDSLPCDWSPEQKRLYTQKFFNRLMFLAFLERKGWMAFNGRRDYLRALFDDYIHNDPEKRTQANFHRKRLNALFFMGLSNSREQDVRNEAGYKPIMDLIGEVPYLNGGLFDKEADDETCFFPDTVVAHILTDLIYAFNFTVTESTPLDVEVAVDPEMLGKIFEELVTGRHESGSYYTPKPVVAFMCREALKGYLETALLAEPSEALARFVEEHEGGALRDPEAALEALKRIKVCDPACGSGAYLLGMLHELLALRECLFVTRSLDPKNVYERKLEIIQNCLYGVDIDPFAVNIARLRLWLSLIVDFEGATPLPLPNLNYKIETGDSLTAPDPSGQNQVDMFRLQKIKDFAALKAEHLNSHSERKKEFEKKIDNLRAEIATWSHPTGTEGFDWVVEYAEVFMPELAQPTSRAGGFDIVLANPPYVRQELISDLKPVLKRVYGDLYTGTADLYIYFYLRAHQLLRPGGVACFISSNKRLRAGYGETLRRHLLDEQAFMLVVDFGELPVFQTAATFPAIFVWRKEKRGETPTKWAVVKNLQECYDEGIVEYVSRIAQILPATQFGKGKSRLNSQKTTSQRSIMESKGQRLGELMGGEINFGIKTGFNEAYWIDHSTYKKLVSLNKRNTEIIKPLLRGDDIRRYESHFRNVFILWVYIGVPINEYPEILEHLKGYENQLRKRLDQGKYWWELRTCEYYDLFQKPKIIYPIIGKTSRFVMDISGYFTNDKTFFLPTGDWYLLGILNSQSAFEYLKSTCSVLGDEMKGGRLEFRSIYMKTLPIPETSENEHNAVAQLAQEAQNLHTQRRSRVEQFLHKIGIDPAQSTSRNPLETPWALSQEDFTRRAKSAPLAAYMSAREETSSLTDEIVKVEAEIDERVKGLYGL